MTSARHSLSGPRSVRTRRFALNGRRRTVGGLLLVGAALAVGVSAAAPADELRDTRAKFEMLWNTGEPPLRHPATVWNGCFSPDGKLVVTSAEAPPGGLGQACVCDADTLQLVATFQRPGGTSCMNSVFSPDGKTVLTSMDPRLLVLWDPLTGKEIRTFDASPITSMFVKYFPDGKRVLTAALWGNDPGMHVWDVATGRIVNSFKMDTGGVASFAIAPDGKTVVTGDQNSEFSVRLWSTETWATVWTYPREHLGEGGIAVWDVAFAENGKYLAAATSDACFLLEAATGKVLCRLPEYDAGNGVAFLPGDRQLLCSGLDGYVAKYEVPSGKLVERTPRLATSLLGLSLTKDKTRAVMGSFDGLARIVGTRDLNDRGQWRGRVDGALRCAVTPDGAHLVTLHAAGGLRSWKAQTGEPGELLKRAPAIAGYAGHLAVSPDGRQVLLCDYRSPALTLLDLQTGERLPALGQSEVVSKQRRLTWVAATGTSAVYAVSPDALAVLDLRTDQMTPVDGLDPEQFVCHEVVAARTGTFLVGVAKDCSRLAVRALGATAPPAVFALRAGWSVNRCAVAPDGQFLLALQSNGQGECRVACYPLGPGATELALVPDDPAAGLGAKTFREREEAQQRLERLGRRALPALERAARSADPEVRARATALAAKIPPRGQQDDERFFGVALGASGGRVLELHVCQDGRRWVAVTAKGAAAGVLDTRRATLAVLALLPFAEQAVDAAVFDDGRRCATVGLNTTLAVWAINWAEAADPQE